MKYIPDCITVVRFICSVLLLFIKAFSPAFFILYIVCGISDALDGFIARKTHTVSRTGQIFDSCADAALFIIMLVIYFRTLKLPFPVTGAVFVVCSLRLSSIAAGFIRWHKPAFLHTYANKAAGFIVFCFPLIYVFLPRTAYVIVCLITTVSATEELIINLTAKKLDREAKGLFILHRA